MNNKILNTSLNNIKKRKHANELKSWKNNQLANSSPQIQKLIVEIKTEEMSLAKKEVFGEKVNYDYLNSLKNDCNLLLKSKNLTYEDLTPNYTCKICNDNGYKDGFVCDCLKEEINRINLKECNTSKKLSNFDENCSKNEQINAIFDKLHSWAIKDDKSKTFIFISGPTGTGKTFLVECLLNEFMNKKKIVTYSTVFNLNNSIISTFSSKEDKVDDIISNYVDCDVLALDDLGTEPILKNVTREYLYSIINERMVNNKITIFSSNLTPDDVLNRYGDRIFSRIFNKRIGIAIELCGEDLRLKKN